MTLKPHCILPSFPYSFLFFSPFINLSFFSIPLALLPFTSLVHCNFYHHYNDRFSYSFIPSSFIPFTSFHNFFHFLIPPSFIFFIICFYSSSIAIHFPSPFSQYFRPSFISFPTQSAFLLRLPVCPPPKNNHYPQEENRPHGRRLRGGTSKNHPIVNPDLGEKILCSLTCVLHSLAIVLPRENGLEKIRQ